jgi:Ser/Thr protein kinase RdoA (MazF antagonist)
VPEQLRAVASAVCATALDASPVTVHEPPTGNVKRTALTTLDDGREVVVQYRERSLAAEAAVTRAVANRTDVPVASVLAAGQLDDPPVSYLVTARVNGEDLHERFVGFDGATRERLARALGRYLADVHRAFAFDGPGRVAPRGADESGTLVVPEPLPAGAFYREYLDRALADWPDALADLAPRVNATVDGRLDDLPADARLFPWDYRPGNVVVQDAGGDSDDSHCDSEDGPEIAAVLDWGDPLAAAPRLSAAKAAYTLCDWYVRDEADVAAIHDAFREGYAAVRPFPDRAYDTFQLLGIAASAADSQGEVTRPRYPVVDEAAAITFHREHIEATLGRMG